MRAQVLAPLVAPIIAALVGVTIHQTALADSLLVSQSTGFLGYGYGFPRWSIFNADIDAQFDDVQTTSDFSNLAQVLAADAIMLDQRWDNGVLGAAEAANITAFAATGRRVLLFGENDAFLPWNNQILSIVDGTYNNETSGLTVPVAIEPTLLAGVSSVGLVYAGQANVSVGSTALFDQNFATLWRAEQNVLTVLDVNVMDDDYANVLDNAVFANNIAVWLGTPVPEPAAIAIMSPLVLAGMRVGAVFSHARSNLALMNARRRVHD